MVSVMDDEQLRTIFLEVLAATVFKEAPIKVPLINIGYQANVSIEPLNGKFKVTPDQMYNVSIADLAIASIFFPDVKPLFQGDTGIGKSVLADVVFTSLFGAEGEYWTTIRLGGSGININNDPYSAFFYDVEPSHPNYQKIDPDKINQFYAIFVDEPNRGEPDKMLQLLDGKIRQGSGVHYIGIQKKSGELIPSIVYGAQNPNNGDFSTGDMDRAAENRFLLVHVLNTLNRQGKRDFRKSKTEQAAMQTLFWDTVIARANEDGYGLKETSKDWKKIYERIRNVNGIDSHFSFEIADSILAYIGGDPVEEFELNKSLVKECGIDAKITYSKNEGVSSKLAELSQNQRYGFVGRDINDLVDLSRLFGFIRGYKTQTGDIKVTVNEVAAAFAMVTQTKFKSDIDANGYIPFISEAIVAYDELRKSLNINEGDIKESYFVAALEAGTNKNYESMMKTLGEGIKKLNNAAIKGAKSVIQSRVLADMSVLNHFCSTYSSQITQLLKESGDVTEALSQFKQLYHDVAWKEPVYDRIGFIYNIKV